MGNSITNYRAFKRVKMFLSKILLLFGIAFTIGYASARNFGAINMKNVGQVHVVGPDWTTEFVDIHDDGNGFTLSRGGRIYFAKYAANDFSDPWMYWQASLKGRHFSYDIDVSNVGCHCNAAGYFIQMPGYGSNQQPNPGEGGDYYCDANLGNNIWCPEYDTWEGNKYTMASTLHTCNYNPPKYYDWCDRGGCQTNAYRVNSNLMCPEDRCTINTNRPFTISHSQGNGLPDGQMDYVNNWFEQDGRTASFNVCDNDKNYVKNMGYSLDGIVFSASLWGGPDIDMSWLDGMTGCQGECKIWESSVSFRNFALTENHYWNANSTEYQKVDN